MRRQGTAQMLCAPALILLLSLPALVRCDLQAHRANDRLGKLIRNAEKAKITAMSVVGAKEVEATALSVPTPASGELGSIAWAEGLEPLKTANQNHGDFWLRLAQNRV